MGRRTDLRPIKWNEDDFDEYDDIDERDDRNGKSEKGSGRGRRRWNGGSFSREDLGRVGAKSGEEPPADEPEEAPEAAEDASRNEEIEQIHRFRNPLFNTEVWFVAIGSDTELHDGARAFAAEHADELRGSMIIEVESLGLGELSVASEEGRYRKMPASSRVKRYMRQATNVTGIAPGAESLVGTDSITTVLQKAGYQTMHLFGEENGKPALKGSADDVLENIDDIVLDENVNFLLELVKRG